MKVTRRQLKLNMGSPSLERERQTNLGNLGISGGSYTGDSMHDIFKDFGYPENVSFQQLWHMYRRLGIAKNACNLPVQSTWAQHPKIKGTDQFNAELEQIPELISRIKALDKRQRVGRYAALFMRVADDKKPSEELETGLNGVASLVGMTPIYEGQLRVNETDNDPQSKNYGLPKMYHFQSSGQGNRNEQASASLSIHPSRLIIAAEDADNGGIYGTPAIEGCFNSLMDIRKIIGAGGEGFYRNAAQSIVFELDESGGASADLGMLKDFNDNADDFMRNRRRRSLFAPHMKASTLDSNLVSPKDFFMNALNDVAANTGIPATILIGQQTGRLASGEDSDHFLAMTKSRQENWATQLLSSVLDWFIKYGILPASKYEITFADPLELSDEAKLESCQKMAEINSKQFNSGQEPVFSAEEIRKQAGYDDTVEIDLLENEGETLDGEED